MRGIGVVMTALAVCWLVFGTFSCVRVDNIYTQDIQGYWNLSVKASTLEMKSEYMDKFADSLKRANLSGHNAIWLKNPDNSFEQNFLMVQSLQQRLDDIKKMDPKSLEYQQAMAQITGQEQGEGQKMLAVFEGCWYLTYHPWFWDWICFCVYVGFIIVGIFGVILIGAGGRSY